jgi:hypothetical protein
MAWTVTGEAACSHRRCGRRKAPQVASASDLSGVGFVGLKATGTMPGQRAVHRQSLLKIVLGEIPAPELWEVGRRAMDDPRRDVQTMV